MHRVKLPGRELFAKDGVLLSSVLMENGIPHDHPCGGKGTCRKCLITVNGEKVLSCQYKIHSDIEVEPSESGKIFSETGAETGGKAEGKLAFALDIGTTTLALALVALDTQKIVRVVTETNPQRTFGADIMSRIGHCMKNGPLEMHSVLIKKINEMIAAFDLHEEIPLYAAGNATMLHLFFNIDCSGIGTAPYTPVFLEEKHASGKDLALNSVSEVIALPSIASFVGADLVAGLNYVGLPKNGKYNILADLGTNAEIILFSKDSVLSTAAAAGPCFEGANISCGMSATKGAIYRYEKDGSYKTIGDAEAKGICGTGLIDAMAALLANETVDFTGYMEEEEYVLAENVSLTQEDIRQYQLAKSAVCSAMMTLMDMAGIGEESIGTLYISGGFSAKIDRENAARTGLLPEILKDRISAISNSSLLGTVKFACEKNDLSVFLENAEYADLSQSKRFSDLFMENMFFGEE
ncbi:MAG: DUF4445 domain-containing protein [Christensenellaceae bacterium]|nr:DUF4445 domain-containing protein [Christensenellaceae bacterium]